jgi:hypothetical protein
VVQIILVTQVDDAEPGTDNQENQETISFNLVNLIYFMECEKKMNKLIGPLENHLKFKPFTYSQLQT